MKDSGYAAEHFLLLRPAIFESSLTVFGLGFCQPETTGRGGGGQNGYRPNLASSSHMTMKLVKDILWVEIFRN